MSYGFDNNRNLERVIVCTTQVLGISTVQLIEWHNIVEVKHLPLLVKYTVFLDDMLHELDIILDAFHQNSDVDFADVRLFGGQYEADIVVDGAAEFKVAPQTDHDAALEADTLREEVETPLPGAVLVGLSRTERAGEEHQVNVVLRYHQEVLYRQRRAPHVVRVVPRLPVVHRLHRRRALVDLQ